MKTVNQIWWKKGVGCIIVMVTDKNGNEFSIGDVSVDRDCDMDNEEEFDYLDNLAKEVAYSIGYEEENK